MVTKKGLTLLELLISMALLAIIAAATTSIFAVAINNFRVSFAQSGAQKDINLVVDDISRNVKLAASLPTSHGTYHRDQDTLILALPAIDGNRNFIYNNQVLEKDFVIYQLEGNQLKKITLPSPQSARNIDGSRTRTVLENVSLVNFTHNDPLFTKVSTEIIIRKTISNTDLEISGRNVAVRRNEG